MEKEDLSTYIWSLKHGGGNILVIDKDKVARAIKIFRKDENEFLTKIIIILRNEILNKLPKDSNNSSLLKLDNEINLRMALSNKRYNEIFGPKLTGVI